MSQTIGTTLGGVLLLAAMGLGWWRWVRPRRPLLYGGGTGLLVLLVLALMGGTIGAPAWWFDADDAFSWPLLPLAGRFLASASLGFAFASYRVLEHPSPRHLRLVLLLLAVYLWPLAAAILVIHLDRFDSGAVITYAFFVIVGIMSIATAWYLLRQPPVDLAPPIDEEGPAPSTRLWLYGLAIVAGLWGLALFVSDEGFIDAVWLWPGDLLTSRLIAAMLFAVAAGSVYASRSAQLSKTMLGLIAVYGFGLALASLWQTLDDAPVKPLYLAFGLVAGTGGALFLWLESRETPGISSRRRATA